MSTSANIQMFTPDGKLILITSFPSTHSNQQLDDYQKIRKVLLDYWFQVIIGTFRGESTKDKELTQVTNFLRARMLKELGLLIRI